MGGVLLLVMTCEAMAAPRPDVTFLHICDVYNLTARDDKGGFARFATRLDEARRNDPDALFLLPGDFLSPSLLSSLFKGRQMVEMLNLLRLDYASVGNHEFDQGLENLGQNVTLSRFTWLASNLQRRGALLPGMKRQELRTVRGVKVGLFAVLDPELAALAHLPPEVTITDPFEAARTDVAALRKAGAELVVAMSHMAFPMDRELARRAPGIDLILGGHDHIITSEVVGETLLVESGHELEVLGQIRMGPGAPKSIEMVTFLPVDARVPPDPVLAAKVAEYEKELDQTMNQEVGRLTSPMEISDAVVRTRETAVGNLVAEAMRAHGGATIGLMNGGGLRSNRTWAAGPITRREVLSLLPFNNVVVTLELSGGALVQVLEHALSGVEQAKGRFPQLAGLKVVYQPAATPGQRVREVWVGDAKVEAERLYTLATSDYLAEGGDGFALLRQARRIVPANQGALLTEVVIQYLGAHLPYVPPPLGRVVRLAE